jgi:hypothetical protein
VLPLHPPIPPTSVNSTVASKTGWLAASIRTAWYVVRTPSCGG